MTLEAKKLELIQRLAIVENASTLQIVEEALNADQLDSDWQLSPEQERSLEISIAQADAGETIPHEEVMREIRKKYQL